MRPIGELEDFDEQVRMMFDLIALAYQADLTRVASYVMVAEGTDRTYTNLGDAGRLPSASAIMPTSASALPSCSRSSTTTWSGSRSSSKKLADTKEGDGSCSTIRCSCTARTWATATRTTTIRCRKC